MKTGEFLTHSIIEGTFSRGRAQEYGRRLRELGYFPKHEDLTSQHAAALLFGLTFESFGALVGAIQLRTKDFNEVVKSLAMLLNSPEMLSDVESLEFSAVCMKVKYSSHSFFAGTSPKSEIYQTTFIKGDWLRLFALAMTVDKFINDTY